MDANVITGAQAACMREYVDADVARGLEQERDELLKENAELTNTLDYTHKTYLRSVEKIKAENAALKDALRVSRAGHFRARMAAT